MKFTKKMKIKKINFWHAQKDIWEQELMNFVQNFES